MRQIDISSCIETDDADHFTLQDKRVQAIVQRSLVETEVKERSASSLDLVPAEEAQTDLGEEMRKLQTLADTPVTPGAAAVSPTIFAGTPGPALSGVLANTEGLSAFEQIIKLREVRLKTTDLG